MDPKLLEMLVCPVTKGPLIHDRGRSELISRSAPLARARSATCTTIGRPPRSASGLPGSRVDA